MCLTVNLQTLVKIHRKFYDCRRQLYNALIHAKIGFKLCLNVNSTKLFMYVDKADLWVLGTSMFITITIGLNPLGNKLSYEHNCYYWAI